MSIAGDLNPPVAPAPAGPAPSWLRRNRLPVAAAGAALGLGAVSAAAALTLLGTKAGASLERMVPASADVMVVANLDPSATQKLNLLRSLHRFPQATDDKAIADALDKALKGTGISYSADLKPWLGSELGISARLNYDTTVDSTSIALYAVSRDDKQATAALAKLRSGSAGKLLRWSDETYNGFQLSVGTPVKATDKTAAYSLVDHVVVISNSAALIHEIIDTEQGRMARLTDSNGYRSTVSGLPSDRLGLAYVNGASLVTGIKKQLAKAPATSKPLTGNITDLDAFTGIGASLSASSNGLTADMLVKLDQSRLSAATRQALAGSGRPDAVLSWIPKSSDAFLAVGNINRTIQSLIDSSKSDPSIKTSTDAFGLTGQSGILSHLTGDAALEVEVSAGSPGGALLLRTDDSSSLKAFFGRLLSTTSSLTPGATPSVRGAALPSAPRTVTTTYRGVAITSVQAPTSGIALLQPSFAVLDGFGIFASNLAEVRAVIDAHKNGVSIAADVTYKTARAASIDQPATIVYLNSGNLLKAAKTFAGSTAAGLNSSTLSAAEPLKAVMITGSSRSDRIYERLFLLID